VSIFQTQAPEAGRLMAQHTIIRGRLGGVTLERVLVLIAVVGIVALVLVSVL
jgi:hypothetical protein